MFFSLLVLHILGFKQFTLGEQGLVGEPRLVLLADPVSGLMEMHCVLQDHDFKHFLHLGMGEFVLGNKVTDAHRQHMYTLTRELPDIGKQFFPEGPEMLLRLTSSPNSI